MAAALVALAVAPARAGTSLDLDSLKTFPDINATSPTLTFSVDTSTSIGTLVITSMGLQVSPTAGTSDNVFGSYNLTAHFDASNAFMSGDLTIQDGTPSLLLSGTLTEFAIGNGGKDLDFLFDVTGGSLGAYFGSTAGILVRMTAAGAPFPFANGYSTDNLTVDTAALVPEPSTLASSLAGLGIIGAALAHRRARRKVGGVPLA